MSVRIQGPSDEVNLGQREESHGADTGNHSRTERTPGVGERKDRRGLIKEEGCRSGREGREESVLWDVTERRQRKGDWNAALN